MVTGATAGIGARRGARARARRRDGHPARPQRESARSAVPGAEAARPGAVGRADSISSARKARSIKRSRAEIESRYGRLDGLLHNAAILGDRSPIEHYDIGLWQRVLLVDLTAPFILTRCLLPLLRNSADASIVFTTSSVGEPRPRILGRLRRRQSRHREPRRGSRPTSSRARRFASTSSTPGARARECERERTRRENPASVPHARERRAGVSVFARRREPRRPRPALRADRSRPPTPALSARVPQPSRATSPTSSRIAVAVARRTVDRPRGRSTSR